MSKVDLAEEVARLLRLVEKIAKTAHESLVIGAGSGAVEWKRGLETIERVAREES